tara:strand:+ start:109 stop:627 length:519 start_codon:yes stop_codon:yes gene_type:complete
MNDKKKAIPVLVRTLKVNIVFTKPTIFIPTKKDKKGNEVPVIGNGRSWYVKFSFRNPKTELLEPFRRKGDINRLKTITERKKAIKILRRAVERWLQDGYSPFEEIKTTLEIKKTFTCKEAIEIALKEKQKVWSVGSKKTKIININVFIKFFSVFASKNNTLCMFTNHCIFTF